MAEERSESEVRRERRDDLRSSGVDPYPSKTNRTHDIGTVLERFELLSQNGEVVGVAGRVMAIRRHGGSAFIVVFDGTGKIQLFCKQDGLGTGFALTEQLDVGDFVESSGNVMKTKRGEPSVLSIKLRLISKALRPLPEKWHGLVDPETKLRKRYLDLLVNESVREAALGRSKLNAAIRSFLDEKGYLEVETPVLQSIPGGATARPFVTHLNALDIDLYLRVAPELYLKRLLVAGFPKVYEMARCFRNEGMDQTHNPEFTQVELYEAYANYEDYIKLVEEMLGEIVPEVTGSSVVKIGDDEINFAPPFEVQSWVELLDAALGESTEKLDDTELRELLSSKGIEMQKSDGRGAMLDAAYKKLIRPGIVQPTFIIDHPIELSPLSKTKADNVRRAERFQLVVARGVELMNGYSELNDPDEQRKRFEEQEALRTAGDVEAQRVDNDYLEALEHGMPPAAGLGIGIDRLAALLAGSESLKDVILFPTLRPKQKS